MFKNLDAEQAKMGLSDKQVAEIIGISPAAYASKKKTGKFYIKEIFELCTLFKQSYEYLFSTDITTRGTNI